MLQQVVVTTANRASLKPLLEAAIVTQLKTIELGLRRTRERLAHFEREAGLSSAEFERRVNAGEQSETLTGIDWLMEIRALRLLEERQKILREARLD